MERKKKKAKKLLNGGDDLLIDSIWVLSHAVGNNLGFRTYELVYFGFPDFVLYTLQPYTVSNI